MTRTQALRSAGRRLVGAVSSTVAVAVMGVTALSPQTAAAAGISTGHRHAVDRPTVDRQGVDRPGAADPEPARQPVDLNRGQPAHSTQPGRA